MEAENIEKQQIESKVNEVFATMSKYEAREEFASFLRNYKSMLNSKPEFASSNLGKEIDFYLESYNDISEDEYRQLFNRIQQDMFEDQDVKYIRDGLINYQSQRDKQKLSDNLKSEKNRKQLNNFGAEINADKNEIKQNLSNSIAMQQQANEQERERKEELKRNLQQLEDKGIGFSILDILILPLIFKYFNHQDKIEQYEKQIRDCEKQLEKGIKNVRAWSQQQFEIDKDAQNLMKEKRETTQKNKQNAKDKFDDEELDDTQENVIRSEIKEMKQMVDKQINIDKLNKDENAEKLKDINDEDLYKDNNINEQYKLIQEIMNQYANINKNNQEINELKNNISPSKEANVEILKKENNIEKSNHSLESKNTLYQTFNKNLNNTKSSFFSKISNNPFNDEFFELKNNLITENNKEKNNQQAKNNTNTITQEKTKLQSKTTKNFAKTMQNFYNKINLQQMNNTMPNFTKQKANKQTISAVKNIY